jgi:hypothetical protein
MMLGLIGQRLAAVDVVMGSNAPSDGYDGVLCGLARAGRTSPEETTNPHPAKPPPQAVDANSLEAGQYLQKHQPALFKAVDTDGDGLLSISEMSEATAKINEAIRLAVQKVGFNNPNQTPETLADYRTQFLSAACEALRAMDPALADALTDPSGAPDAVAFGQALRALQIHALQGVYLGVIPMAADGTLPPDFEGIDTDVGASLALLDEFLSKVLPYGPLSGSGTGSAGLRLNQIQESLRQAGQA